MSGKKIEVPTEVTDLVQSVEKELNDKTQALLDSRARGERATATCSVTVGPNGQASITCSVSVQF